MARSRQEEIDPLLHTTRYWTVGQTLHAIFPDVGVQVCAACAQGLHDRCAEGTGLLCACACAPPVETAAAQGAEDVYMTFGLDRARFFCRSHAPSHARLEEMVAREAVRCEVCRRQIAGPPRQS